MDFPTWRHLPLEFQGRFAFGCMDVSTVFPAYLLPFDNRLFCVPLLLAIEDDTLQEQPHPLTHRPLICRSAVLSLRLVNNLCEPTHALLEPGAMLRITNGRLFWVWSGRDPSRLSASPRVSKSESQFGTFEMRLPALCSYVRPRQTHMKGQPFMHKFAYRCKP